MAEQETNEFRVGGYRLERPFKIRRLGHFGFLEQIAEQLRFTPYPFEDVAQLVSESSPDLYMFSSDYPHAEGGRDPIGRFSRSTEALTKEDREKFFSKNFKVLYPNAFAV